MICRRCIQRSAALVSGASPLTSSSASVARSLGPAIRRQQLQSTNPLTRFYSSSPAPQTDSSKTPTFSTPLGDGDASAADKPKLSSCPEGTILTGLNYFKNKTDPVALADEAYPEWLWSCLDVTKKADDGADEDAGDEFCKYPRLGHAPMYGQTQRPRLFKLPASHLIPTVQVLDLSLSGKTSMYPLDT